MSRSRLTVVAARCSLTPGGFPRQGAAENARMPPPGSQLVREALARQCGGRQCRPRQGDKAPIAPVTSIVVVYKSLWTISVPV